MKQNIIFSLKTVFLTWVFMYLTESLLNGDLVAMDTINVIIFLLLSAVYGSVYGRICIKEHKRVDKIK